MREVDKESNKKPKEHHPSDKDSLRQGINTNSKELELFYLQQSLGNGYTAMLLELEEDETLIKGLSVPIKEKDVAEKEQLKQVNFGQGAAVEDYPEKLGELALSSGLVHIGCHKKDRKIILLSQEIRDDQHKEPLQNSQKIVSNTKPSEARESSQAAISQDLDKGAVAIADSITKKPKKVIETTKRLVAKKEKSGNLKQVMPFLDQGKEKREIKHLQTIKKQLTATDAQQASVIQKKLSNKDIIAEKKKAKEMELSKKIERSLKKLKKDTVQPTSDDFFDLLFTKIRKKSEEEQGSEQDGQWQEGEEEQK